MSNAVWWETLDAREAALLAAEAGADLLVPMHWDTIKGNLGSPEDVVATVRQLSLALSVLSPARPAILVSTG